MSRTDQDEVEIEASRAPLMSLLFELRGRLLVCVAAFILAFIVVRYALDFISRHGFAPFAYWRIFVGAIGLWGVLLFG